jgi:Tfp pilus assembly PilM family ATPase
MNLGAWMTDARLDAAVEIAPGWVTAVAVSGAGAQARVSAAGGAEVPAGAIVPSLTDRNIVDREAVVGAVRLALESVDSRPRRVGLVVPDVTARVSLVSFAEVPARAGDLEQLIRWQVRKGAPFPIDDAVIGHTPAGTDADGASRFAVVLARRDVVREYEDVCDAVGAQAGLVDLASLSALNVVLGAARGVDGDWLLVHVRPEYTSLAVMRGASLLFFRTRPATGGESVGDLVHQTVMYFHDRLDGAEFAQVFLGGRGADARALDAARQSLDERLGVVVETLDLATGAALPDAVAADAGLVAVAGPAAGMLLRARHEPVGV